MASFEGPLFDFSPEVDFCVWVLEVDGVRIAPFDRHPGGGGPLAMSGIDANEWHEWIRTVAVAVDRAEYIWVRTAEIAREEDAQFRREHEAKLRREGRTGLGTLEAVWTVARRLKNLAVRVREIEKPPPVHPPQLWAGDERVSARLRELWEAYQPHRKERGRHLLTKAMVEFRSSPEMDALLRTANELYVAPSLHPQFQLVRYRWPLLYLIPESRVVVGVKGWIAPPAVIRATLEEVLEALVDASRIDQPAP